MSTGAITKSEPEATTRSKSSDWFQTWVTYKRSSIFFCFAKYNKSLKKFKVKVFISQIFLKKASGLNIVNFLIFSMTSRLYINRGFFKTCFKVLIIKNRTFCKNTFTTPPGTKWWVLFFKQLQSGNRRFFRNTFFRTSGQRFFRVFLFQYRKFLKILLQHPQIKSYSAFQDFLRIS